MIYMRIFILLVLFSVINFSAIYEFRYSSENQSSNNTNTNYFYRGNDTYELKS